MTNVKMEKLVRLSPIVHAELSAFKALSFSRTYDQAIGTLLQSVASSPEVGVEMHDAAVTQ